MSTEKLLESFSMSLPYREESQKQVVQPYPPLEAEKQMGKT